MDTLQRLLDEKWPLKGLDEQDAKMSNYFRRIWLDGFIKALHQVVSHEGSLTEGIRIQALAAQKEFDKLNNYSYNGKS